MSSGPFELSKYESNRTGLVHPIRVQPETLDLVVNGETNTPPVGAIASPISAAVSRSKRALGLNARTVTIRLTATLAGYSPGAILTLPWLTPAGFDGFARGQAATYQSTAAEVVGVSAETAN